MVALLVVFWYDLSQGLITIPCQDNGIDGWWLCLVEAFNLIEFFGVAALFGWLTFLVATDDMVKRIEQGREEREAKSQRGKTKDKTVEEVPKEKEDQQKQKEKETRRTLNTINDYFIISFLFYAFAAVADYFFAHKTILGESARYGLAGLTAATFATGTIVLALPVVYLLFLDHGRDVFVQQRSYALGLCISTVANIIMLALVLPKSSSGRPIIIVPMLFTFAGFCLAMAGKMTVRRFIEVWLLFLLSWVVVGLMVALNITYLDFSPVVS
jgi:hypothetical protein